MAPDLVTNVRAFNEAVEKAVKRIPEEKVKAFTKKVALEVLKGVVLLTPVDTGRARGNWQLDIENIPEGEIDTTDKDGGPTIAKGLANLAALAPFQTVYIANNVPYIVFLEEGTDKMAPVGMVSRTVARLAFGLSGEKASE